MLFLSRISRSGAALLCAGALMIPFLASCGGGGGGSNPSNTGTPTPTSIPGSTTCSNSTYTPNYASSVSPLRWQLFPLRVFFVPNDEFSAARRTLALAGFNQWVVATQGRVDYTVVSSKSSSNVEVSFYRFTGGAGDTLGTTTVSYDDQGIRQATIKLGITGSGAEDTATAAHEFGHALGIIGGSNNGHSPHNADIMYFTGNRSGDLTTADLNTLLTAYCTRFNRDSNRTTTAVGPLKTIVVH